MTDTRYLYPLQTMFVGGILFSRCPCVRQSMCSSVRDVLVFPQYLEKAMMVIHQTLQTHCYR